MDVKHYFWLLIIAASLLTGCTAEDIDMRSLIGKPTTSGKIGLSNAQSENSDRRPALQSAQTVAIYSKGPTTILVDPASSVAKGGVTVYVAGENTPQRQVITIIPLNSQSQPGPPFVCPPVALISPVSIAKTMSDSARISASQPAAPAVPAVNADSPPTPAAAKDGGSHPINSLLKCILNWLREGITTDKPANIAVAACGVGTLIVAILAWQFPQRARDVAFRAFQVVTK